eukprot:CAMPEP_0195529456 /NCGR_PEP_ID=MMETSP0794_2-20130614/31991_1 /TAXON_ID=515487 /ORGANISM="Stephanopyxis turris, Strain CCMP 815" /LENGTH=221 /DNA_ID=CAMNT_0040660763 /DNA_START=353 /DNA_END=1018 /DNA_ORIENTATION=-
MAAPINFGGSTESTDNEEVQPTEQKAAATNTVNERLMAELEREVEFQKGPNTAIGQKTAETLGGIFKNYKSDEERQQALEEAKDLNGVNPVVAIVASLFSFVFAIGLWWCTAKLGAVFAEHPVVTDVYAVQRLATVFRNVVVGIFTLASGFSGVTGVGLFLLGTRVAYGVARGELDPTPIRKKSLSRGFEFDDGDDGGQKVGFSDAWDFMMGKKDGKKGRR